MTTLLTQEIPITGMTCAACVRRVENAVAIVPGSGTFGGYTNTVHLIDAAGVEDWPTLSKDEVGRRLAERIALRLGTDPS